MPIRQFLGREAAFQPEELQAMGDAFSAALNRLGLVDREDPMVEMVARRIVRAAIAGERNVSTLTEVGTNGRD